MHHYICLGGCEGVSEQPKKCGEKTCRDHNQDLKHCDCTDGKHFGAFPAKGGSAFGGEKEKKKAAQ